MIAIPLGDSAVTLELGGEISEATAAQAQALAANIRAAALVGVIDIVAAYTAVTVYYDPGSVDYATLSERLSAAGAGTETAVSATTGREREIPVCYGGEFGPDLEEVARRAQRTNDEVVQLHAGAAYVVHAVGFAPGFGYLGGLPMALRCPRRATPRAVVAAGSVGIGGAQTGVYPLATPGGWNVIGRTPLRLFDPARAEPSWLRAGDRVTFRAISEEEFRRWA